MSLNKYHQIPTEMRIYRQWLVWRYEDRGGVKPTKVPYTPMTGKMASVTDPNSWCSFDEAVWAATISGTTYNGVGFVLTKDDPYTFIDLDQTTDDVSFKTQGKIFQNMNSYSERSPSGHGLHIICKGHIAKGRKRNSIEIYSSERYMTMTGDVYLDRPIESRQELLQTLWEQMAGATSAGAAMYEGLNQPQTQSDAEITNKALMAANGLKFGDLLEGRWQGYYASQSEADFAFIDIVAFYTQNVEQIVRIFQHSALGQRAKGQRVDYVQRMVHRAFDNQLPLIEFDSPPPKPEKSEVGAPQILKNGRPEVADTATLRLQEFWKPQPLLPPPGLMGDIARFIYDASPRQVAEVAIAGAIGLMAGVCGRSYNISGTGLNQYIVLLAPTGIGKEAIKRGISILISACIERGGVQAAECFMGPAEIASGQAILSHLIDPTHRSFVSVVGEFGLKMQQLSSSRASSSELMLKRVLLDLYNKSGRQDILGSSAYAQKDKNISAIKSPAVTIIGETTPETFYSTIDERLIADGLLPRCMFIEYRGARQYMNKNHAKATPNDQLVQNLSDLMANCLSMQHKEHCLDIGYDSDVESFMDEIDVLTTDFINATKTDALRGLWNRAHIKTMKLAGKIAVGINPYEPKVTLADIHYAYNLVSSDITSISSRFSRGEVGGNLEESQQTKAILRVSLEYIRNNFSQVSAYGIPKNLHEEGVIPYRYIQRRLSSNGLFKNDKRGGKDALNRALQSLLEAGDLREIGAGQLNKQFAFGGRAFVLTEPDKLPHDLGQIM